MGRDERTGLEKSVRVSVDVGKSQGRNRSHTAITGNISRIGNSPLFDMSLLQSPSFKVTNTTLHETFLPAGSYVLSLAPVASFYAALASAPSHQIHLFDRGTLQSTGVLKGHENATTQLCTVRRLGASTREMLLSSGKDGCVMAWDERSGSASIKSGHSTSVSLQTCTLVTQRLYQWKHLEDYALCFVAMRRTTVFSSLPGLTYKKRMRSSSTGQPCIKVRMSYKHLTCVSFPFKGSTEPSSATTLSWFNPL